MPPQPAMPPQPLAPSPRHRLAIIGVLVLANMLALAATDLYLPSVPYLPSILGTDVEGVQFTLVVFSAGFALAQIIFGALGDIYNRRWILVVSLGVFVPASAWCALSGSIESLIAARFLQGISASASAALTIPMIKPLFDEARAVHAISVIGGIDAIIPAFAPILGAWIFSRFGWEASFWVLVFAGLPLLIASVMLVPDDRPESPHRSFRASMRGYGFLLTRKPFLGYAVSHGFSLAGLLAVVFSAPVLIFAHMQGGPKEYIYCQIIWVAIFLSAAQATGRLMKWWGADALIWRGNILQIISAFILCLYSVLCPAPVWQGLALCVVPYAIGLGLRGGAGFAQAVNIATGHETRASALIIFFSIALTGAATGAIAPLLQTGLWSAGAAMLLLSVTALAFLPLTRQS